METYAILSKKHLPRKMYRYQFQQPKIHSQVCILNAWFKEYTEKFNELIFFFIYTQSYYLFCVNVNVINNRILDHLFHIFYNYFYRHEIQNYHKMRILKILISLALGYAITSHIALRFTIRYISLTQTYILT